eukprot:gene10528-11464_t
MSKASLMNSNGKKQWPLTLCGCYSYRDLKGEQRWWPTFCCTAMICSNMMAGRVCTQVVREEPCFCGLGFQGCLVCMATLPIGVYHPIAGFGIFCCLSNYLRDRVVERYNVEEEQVCCCGGLNYYINFLHFGCNYPCSLFQVNMAVERWEEEAKATPAVATVTAQPVVSTNIVYVQSK